MFYLSSPICLVHGGQTFSTVQSHLWCNTPIVLAAMASVTCTHAVFTYAYIANTHEWSPLFSSGFIICAFQPWQHDFMPILMGCWERERERGRERENRQFMTLQPFILFHYLEMWCQCQSADSCQLCFLRPHSALWTVSVCEPVSKSLEGKMELSVWRKIPLINCTIGPPTVCL